MRYLEPRHIQGHELQSTTLKVSIQVLQAVAGVSCKGSCVLRPKSSASQFSPPPFHPRLSRPHASAYPQETALLQARGCLKDRLQEPPPPSWSWCSLCISRHGRGARLRRNVLVGSLAGASPNASIASNLRGNLRALLSLDSPPSTPCRALFSSLPAKKSFPFLLPPLLYSYHLVLILGNASRTSFVRRLHPLHVLPPNPPPARWPLDPHRKTWISSKASPIAMTITLL